MTQPCPLSILTWDGTPTTIEDAASSSRYWIRFAIHGRPICAARLVLIHSAPWGACDSKALWKAPDGRTLWLKVDEAIGDDAASRRDWLEDADPCGRTPFTGAPIYPETMADILPALWAGVIANADKAAEAARKLLAEAATLQVTP